jgi:hypothetical protein
MLESCWVAVQLAASQKGPSSVKLVSYERSIVCPSKNVFLSQFGALNSITDLCTYFWYALCHAMMRGCVLSDDPAVCIHMQTQWLFELCTFRLFRMRTMPLILSDTRTVLEPIVLEWCTEVYFLLTSIPSHFLPLTTFPTFPFSCFELVYFSFVSILKFRPISWVILYCYVAFLTFFICTIQLLALRRVAGSIIFIIRC